MNAYKQWINGRMDGICFSLASFVNNYEITKFESSFIINSHTVDCYWQQSDRPVIKQNFWCISSHRELPNLPLALHCHMCYLSTHTITLKLWISLNFGPKHFFELFFSAWKLKFICIKRNRKPEWSREVQSHLYHSSACKMTYHRAKTK